MYPTYFPLVAVHHLLSCFNWEVAARAPPSQVTHGNTHARKASYDDTRMFQIKAYKHCKRVYSVGNGFNIYSTPTQHNSLFHLTKCILIHLKMTIKCQKRNKNAVSVASS